MFPSNHEVKFIVYSGGCYVVAGGCGVVKNKTYTVHLLGLKRVPFSFE
jgi:hypothetical protein